MLQRLRYPEIETEDVGGISILRASGLKPLRRVFYLNSYGMAEAWKLVQEGSYPAQHLWGCLELAQQGYEVAMPHEPDTTSAKFNYRRQDFNHIRFIASWLGSRGIVYSAHTVLFWMPLLASLRLSSASVVTMLYARGESLRFVRGYRAALALTPAAAARIGEIAPNLKSCHIGWGVDFSFFPELPYNPRWFLSCGKTKRDFGTLAAAASQSDVKVHLINSSLPGGIRWPGNVELFSGSAGSGWQSVEFGELIYNHYASAIAVMILLEEDSHERFAAGFTQLLEALALARPVIVTRTGALAGEIDVEREGCGIFVPANDPGAVAEAMRFLAENPSAAQSMGAAGRRLCEKRYNMPAFCGKLHDLFQSI